MSDLSAEDYARVAVAIGMEWIACGCAYCKQHAMDGWWRDDIGPGAPHAPDLRDYLAEPAQMVRILKLDGLPGEGWALSQHGHYWIAARMKDLAEHDAPVFRPVWQSGLGEAVRDCAARALRP